MPLPPALAAKLSKRGLISGNQSQKLRDTKFNNKVFSQKTIRPNKETRLQRPLNLPKQIQHLP